MWINIEINNSFFFFFLWYLGSSKYYLRTVRSCPSSNISLNSHLSPTLLHRRIWKIICFDKKYILKLQRHIVLIIWIITDLSPLQLANKSPLGDQARFHTRSLCPARNHKLVLHQLYANKNKNYIVVLHEQKKLPREASSKPLTF